MIKQFWIVFITSLALISCQSPVTSYKTVNSSSSLVLGNGISIYVATADGNGILTYANGAENWAQMDWSSLYSNNNPYSQTLTSANSYAVYPPVNDLAISNSILFAATDDGLIVGTGASIQHFLSGIIAKTLAIYNSEVFISTENGLYYGSIAQLSGGTSPQLVSGIAGMVKGWVCNGTQAFVATSTGLYQSSVSPWTTYSLVSLSSTNPWSTSVQSLSLASPESKLYVGTSAGLWSCSVTSPTNWTHDFGSIGVVNSVLAVGSLIFVSTSTGILISSDQGISWNIIESQAPAENIAEGSDTTTWIMSNSTTGVGILNDSNGNFSWSNSYLVGYNISKVFITNP